jgi:hypothetical protein
MSLESEFLTFSADKLVDRMGRIETCVRKLTPQQVWTRGSENQNAVGNLLLHLNGNLGQWMLHGIGGQPDVRDRDGEFLAQNGRSPEELLASLRTSVDEAVRLIRFLPPERMLERITPQDHEVTVMRAIYHVVEHFAGHTFQIILLTKLFTGEDLGFYAHLSGPKLKPDPHH